MKKLQLRKLSAINAIAKAIANGGYIFTCNALLYVEDSKYDDLIEWYQGLFRENGNDPFSHALFRGIDTRDARLTWLAWARLMVVKGIW